MDYILASEKATRPRVMMAAVDGTDQRLDAVLDELRVARHDRQALLEVLNAALSQLERIAGAVERTLVLTEASAERVMAMYEAASADVNLIARAARVPEGAAERAIAADGEVVYGIDRGQDIIRPDEPIPADAQVLARRKRKP